MIKPVSEPERQWMSLGAACRILQVNEATLRRWSDRGLVRAFRTPGGHRRFFREDINTLTQKGSTPPMPESQRQWEEMALKRIRRRLHHNSVTQQPWHQSIDEGGRSRMRLFGRRLLSLVTMAANDRRRRHDVLEEAHLLGKEYGQEMAMRAIPLTDTVEAFVFFRSSLGELAQGDLTRQVSALTDQVLLGISSAYEHQIEDRLTQTNSIPSTSSGRG